MENFTVTRRKLLKLGLAAGASVAAWTAGLLPEITSASVSAEGLQKMPTDAKRVTGPGLRQILKEAYDDERVRALRSKAVELGYSRLPYAAEPVVIDAGNNQQVAHITFASQNSASKDFFYIQVVRENGALTTVLGSTVHYLRSSASTVQEAMGAIEVTPVQLPVTPKPLFGGVIDA
ncbi:MAG: hypothetical protein ABI334_06675, partial [Candidatus Dormiibacterota bacterium]